MGPKVVNFLKRTCNSALIYMSSLIFSQQTLYILYKLQRWLTAKICGTIHNTNTYTTELWTNCLLCVHFWYTYQPSGLSILILFLYIIIPRLRCCTIDINLHRQQYQRQGTTIRVKYRIFSIIWKFYLRIKLLITYMAIRSHIHYTYHGYR